MQDCMLTLLQLSVVSRLVGKTVYVPGNTVVLVLTIAMHIFLYGSN